MHVFVIFTSAGPSATRGCLKLRYDTNLQLHVERPKESLNKRNCLNKCIQNQLVGIMQDYKEKSALYLFKN